MNLAPRLFQRPPASHHVHHGLAQGLPRRLDAFLFHDPGPFAKAAHPPD